MPLAEQLLAGAAAGGGSGGSKRDSCTPETQDVCTLLVHTLLRVQQGQPLRLDTVKAAWRDLAFSHVFEVGAGARRQAVPAACAPA